MATLDEFHMSPYEPKFRLFDPEPEIQVEEGKLPPWGRAGTI